MTNTEVIGSLDKSNLICAVEIETLSGWIEESMGSEEGDPGRVATLLKCFPIKGSWEPRHWLERDVELRKSQLAH